MKNIQTILLILLISCSRNKNVSKQIEVKDTVQDKSKFEFIIKDGQIGNIKTGEQLIDVFDKLKEFVVEQDSVPECEACDTYSPMYRINDHRYQNLFVFEPGWDSISHNKLFRIATSNERFVTDRGIKVGMTVKDLKEKYEIEEIDVAGETGIHAIVKNFKGSFGIESPRINDWWKINKENIPDSLKIDSIIIL